MAVPIATATTPPRPHHHRWVPRFMRPPAPSRDRITDPAEVRREFAHYRPRILFWSTAGYALFYFVRANLPVAQKVIGDQLNIPKDKLGLVLSLHGIVYGVSKFANGFLGDRANARMMMVLGLAASAVVNIAFGFGHAIAWFALFWMINGWFQGMGFPPCARLLTHWFEPRVLTSRMAVWNASHNVGAAGVMILCGYLVLYDWRLCFFVPAAMALVMCGLLLVWLRDTPESVGLPEVAHIRVDVPSAAAAAPLEEEPPIEALAVDGDDFGRVLMQKVFLNPYIWLFSFANFFVYIIRYGIFDWAPTFLSEAKGVELKATGWMGAAFEVAGLAGILVSGWITDRFFGGRAARIGAVYMALCGASVYLLWHSPAHAPVRNTLLMMAAGFFVYGPQALIGAAAANLATKRAAATAVGLTGLFGYLSKTASGYGIGWLAQHHGWNAVFAGLIGIAAAGTLLFLLAWGAKAHGYDD